MHCKRAAAIGSGPFCRLDYNPAANARARAPASVPFSQTAFSSWLPVRGGQKKRPGAGRSAATAAYTKLMPYPAHTNSRMILKLLTHTVPEKAPTV